jgi:hypothetical protein
MASLIVGGAFTWLGVVMFFDRKGLGTWWRRIGFHYYDQHDPSVYRYQRRTRLFRSYYFLIAFFGLLLCVIGASELL